MTNVDALKYLFEKVGGDAETVEDTATSADLIIKIADQLAEVLTAKDGD